MHSGYLISSRESHMGIVLLMCLRRCLMQSKFALLAYYWDDQ